MTSKNAGPGSPQSLQQEVSMLLGIANPMVNSKARNKVRIVHVLHKTNRVRGRGVVLSRRKKDVDPKSN